MAEEQSNQEQPPAPKPPESVYAYGEVMRKMHNDMMVRPTGDADVDFVKSMIPHHQGAIDMAKILKEKGKDPELKTLADEIIAAQEKEIAFMKDWLTKHEKPGTEAKTDKEKAPF